MKIQKKNVKSILNTVLAMGLLMSVNLSQAAEKKQSASGKSASAVNLGSAANFVILAKSGITTTGTTSIVGNIGVSPIAAGAITGFGLVMNTSNKYSTSALVKGNVYAANYSAPTPSMLTTAVLDMEAAYNDAAGRPNPKATELGDGDISGMTLTAGVYKWSSVVLVNGSLTLEGGANDVFIFQIAQGLTVGSDTVLTLRGVSAKNVFWAVAGVASIGTDSSFSGNILSKTSVTMTSGAQLHGRALTQTNTTLIGNGITISQ